MRLTVLGATGSIGVSTLDVIARHPERYEVVALTAHTNVERLYAQCCALRPRYAALADGADAAQLRERLAAEGLPTEVLTGSRALCELAALPEVDCVVAGIVGAAGLLPSLAAAEAGKRILLANKEVLVMAGEVFMQAVAASGAVLLPLDSEHNAIFQCLPPDPSRRGIDACGVRRLLLTASGGPFRCTPLEQLAEVTPEQACAHPNWSMGRKISVDSATMMNKGLELIEACLLFGAEPARVEVVIHPQSIVHSMVEYVDGSVLAQLGNPDMRTPIAHALAWPERIDSGVSSLNLCQIGSLEFEAPSLDRFPCLRLAYEAAEAGGTARAHLNAANEVAVAAFLAGGLAFPAIAEIVEETLERLPVQRVADLAAVLDADHEGRLMAQRLIRARAAG
jgi:1-deoxy-D-xylulose-5-phosphate reductoisomerase